MNTDNRDHDEILDALRPRMRHARIAHLRRLIAGLAVVPLLGIGAAAMAASGADEPDAQTASGSDADGGGEVPDVALPDIGDAGGDEASAPEETVAPDGDEDTDETDADVSSDEQTKVLSLGPLGSAEVTGTEDGGLELVHTDLVEGWRIVSIEVEDGKIVIVVTNGDKLKMITIAPGVRNEIDVRVVDVVIPPPPTTTTTTVKPPPGPVVDRFVVQVPGKGSFVVEREGETLFLGAVSPNEGYDYDVHMGEGWKVSVSFTDGRWRWYAKALINDDDRVELLFWDEEVLPEPVFQWVEVPAVGAVKFKLYHDGLIYVKEWVSECCGFNDYNEDVPGETAKVEFKGDGILWIIEVWKNGDGGMSWSTTDLSPEPAAEPPPPTVPVADQTA